TGFNANGANGNPDMDVMVGDPNGIKHLNVYIEDYINETFWTGKEALPFNPTLGWNENSLNTSIPAGPHFTNLEEFRVAEYMIQMGVVNAVDKNNWLQYTTDPCDNDTDGDGLPDGWELYVGLDPTPGSGPSLAFNVPELAEQSKLARLGFAPDAVPVGMLYGSPFGKEMLPDFPFAIDKFANPTATAFRDADEIVVVDGVTARRRHFPNPRPDWTYKS
ncbi:MAG: hypothetical protein GX804_06005, partial [Lentisphaerae bacterium]|nr:hypothetical protein [Lentisphaerota bacterium]